MSLTGLDGDSPSRISTVARISRTLADSQNEIAGAIARWAPCEECAQPVKRDWNLCPNCDFLRRSRNGLDGRYSSPLRTERSVMSSGRSGSRSPGSLRSRRSSKSKPPHSAPDVGSIAEAAHVVPDNAWVEEHADDASCEAVLPEPRDAVPLERQKSFCKGFHQPRATVPHFPRVSVAPPSGPLVEASGVKWSNAGATKPKGGRELKNSKLQNALKSKTAAATAEFTEDEWKSFSIHDLSIGDFIKSVSFGLNWQKVSSKPKPARELFNSKLSTALASHTELTVAEWEACGIFDLRRGDFIKVGDSLFTPAMGEAYFTPAVRGTRFQKEQMRHVCDALSSMFALHDSDRQTVTAEVVAGGLSNWLFKVTASPSPIASSTLAAPMTRANCLSEQRLLTFPEHPLLLARRRAADMLGKPVLVRVFGPLALDRETENTVCAQVFLSGIGPRVLATFANGRVEEFLEGFRTLEPHEFLGDVHGRAVAHCLAQLHSKPLLRAIGSGGGADTGGGDMGADSIWKRVERWINIALTKGIRVVDVGRAGEVKSVLMTVRQHVHKWQECLQNMARSGDCACRFWAQVRLCHNDLHVNNIMAHAQKVSRVTLIDFEYACANYIGLDVCNSLANIPFILFLQVHARGGAHSHTVYKRACMDGCIRTYERELARFSNPTFCCGRAKRRRMTQSKHSRQMRKFSAGYTHISSSALLTTMTMQNCNGSFP